MTSPVTASGTSAAAIATRRSPAAATSTAAASGSIATRTEQLHVFANDPEL